MSARSLASPSRAGPWPRQGEAWHGHRDAYALTDDLEYSGYW
jgi:hypothetical protein